MFCPKCSQQQTSDDVRYCSRCGFRLNVVKTLLADDNSSSHTNLEFRSQIRSRRKKDVMTGALLMGVFALHTAWTTEDLSLEGKFTGVVIKCVLLCVLINIIPFIRDLFYARAKEENSLSATLISLFKTKFKGADQTGVLPPAYIRPAAACTGGRLTTAELVPPPSVTEETTDLLRH